MANQEHHHGHDHGHEEGSGFFYSLSNNDGAGGFVIIYTLIALAVIIWLVCH